MTILQRTSQPGTKMIVAWSGFGYDEQEVIKQKVESLGGTWILSADLVAYEKLDFLIVTNDGENLTTHAMKLMTALTYAVKVVSIHWLDDSHKEGRFIPSYDLYIPRNKLWEKKWNFSIKSTIHNASVAQQNGGILAGFSVCINPVDVLMAAMWPPLAELKTLLQAAGANILDSPTSINHSDNLTKILIIADAKLATPELIAAAKGGARIVTLQKIFLVLLQQSRKIILEPINQRPPLPSSNSMQQRSTETINNPVKREGTSINAKASSKQNMEARASKKSMTPELSSISIGNARPANHVSLDFTPSSKTNLESPREKIEFYENVPRDDHIIQSPVKDIFESPVNGDIKCPLKGVVPSPRKDIMQSPDVPKQKLEPLEVVAQMTLTISPRRTTSRRKNEFQKLGHGGILSFLKPMNSVRLFARYTVCGVEMFHSIVPPPESVHKYVKGNAGYENTLYWTAFNKAAAGRRFTRRFYFEFESRVELYVMLFYLLHQDTNLVEEFFRENGRFTVHKDTLPPHKINRDDDEMDIDDDCIEVDDAPDTTGEVEVGFDPLDVSF